jgi:hypothetical protein
MKQILKRYELAVFFLLTYLLSWWAAPLMNGALLPHGPMFAALILAGLTAGRKGMREFWQRLIHFRAGRWYLIGPAIIVAYTIVGFVINLLAGATLVEVPRLMAMGVFLQLLFFGGHWEEPGWTGYALPRLEERFDDRPNGAWIAALVLGIFRAIWHLPLFLYGKLYWFDIFLFSFAIQIIIACLYHRSGGSVPAVMVFHFVSNISGAIMSPVFAGTDRMVFQALFMSLAGLTALALIWFSQTRLKQAKASAM